MKYGQGNSPKFVLEKEKQMVDRKRALREMTLSI
jgi:hypothetical protein